VPPTVVQASVGPFFVTGPQNNPACPRSRGRSRSPGRGPLPHVPRSVREPGILIPPERYIPHQRKQKPESRGTQDGGAGRSTYCGGRGCAIAIVNPRPEQRQRVVYKNFAKSCDTAVMDWVVLLRVLSEAGNELGSSGDRVEHYWGVHLLEDWRGLKLLEARAEIERAAE
jgi:hypothetical protein